MSCDKRYMRLYAVTDRAWVGKLSLYEQVEAALRGGVTCVQLREKKLDKETFLSEALRLKALCARFGVPFVVNDNVEIAIASGADGIHIGQDDLPVSEVRRMAGDSMFIGVTAHTPEEAEKAVRGGADYLGLGAVFATATKSDVRPLSYETLQEICRAAKVPTVAIGGISEENTARLAGSGVDGIAVVSAIFGAADIEAAARRLSALSARYTNAGEAR